MANRVCLGNHPNFGYGLFISKPSKNVLTNLPDRDLIFDSRKDYNSFLAFKARITLNAGQQTNSVSWTNLGFVPQASFNQMNSSFTQSYGETQVYSRFSFSGPFGITANVWSFQDRIVVRANGAQIWRSFQDQEDTTKTRYYQILVYNIPAT